jgi:hypothetical protein
MSKHRRRQKKLVAEKKAFDIYYHRLLQEWEDAYKNTYLTSNSVTSLPSISFADINNQDWSQCRPLTMEDFERVRKLIMGEPI